MPKTMSDIARELAPCPFCHSTSVKLVRTAKAIGHNGLDWVVERHTYSVRCNSCHARGGTVSGKVIPQFNPNVIPGGLKPASWQTTDEALVERAIRLWNKR